MQRIDPKKDSPTKYPRRLQQPQEAIPSVESFNFLLLPCEIRNMVYKKLLCVEEFRALSHPDAWGLTTGLLRANKQIHKEALDVLHRRNIWVSLTLPSGDAVTYFMEHKPSVVHRIPMKAWEKHHHWPPAMDVFFKMHDDNRGEPKQSFLLSEFAMPQLCRKVTTIIKTNKTLTELDGPEWIMYGDSIRLDINAISAFPTRYLDRLTGQFTDAWGLHSVYLGFESDKWASVAKQMENPLPSLADLMHRRQRDTRLANRLFSLGKPEASMCTLIDILGSIRWIKEWYLVDWHTGMISPQMKDMVITIEADIVLTCAEYYVSIGDPASAIKMIWSFELCHPISWMSEAQIRKAYEYLGSAFRLKGLGQASAHSFTLANAKLETLDTNAWVIQSLQFSPNDHKLTHVQDGLKRIAYRSGVGLAPDLIDMWR